MRLSLLLYFILSVCLANAQRKITPSDTLTIKGAIQKELKFTLTDFDTMQKTPLPDIAITNHKGEPKGTLKQLEGVLVKDFLQLAIIDASKPKFLNEYYFVFTATDGYKVVFSWNELFNTETGNHLFILTKINAKPLKEQEERILCIASNDLISGRRYIKGLQQIEVKHAD